MRLTKHEDGYIYGVFCSESGGFYEFTYRIRSGAGTVSPEELMDQVHQMNRITLSFRAEE